MKRKLLTLSFCTLAACNSKTALKSIEWRKGDSARSLDSIQKISTTETNKISTTKEKVEFSKQNFNGVVIEETFVKQLKDSANNPILIRAALSLDEDKLKKLQLNEFAASRSTILQDLQKTFPTFAKSPPEKIEIVIAHKSGFYQPLWRISYTDKKGIPWEVKMNNHLQVSSVRRVGSHFHDTPAFVFPKGPKLSHLEEVVLKNLVASPTLSNDKILVASQADLKISDVVSPLKYNPQDSRFDQVQVFFFLDESLNWFEKKLGAKLPYKLNAEVHVGAPEKTNSAFYYEGKIRIGTGDGLTYANIPQDPSIIVHESVHALIDSIAHLPFEGEGGSLNEAFADFFTAIQLDNPHMGEVSYLKGPFRRTLVNGYKLSDKNGGLYHDSGIISGTLWELRVKFGPDKARDIALLTLNRLVPSSNFDDFGNQLKEVLNQVLNKEDLSVAMDTVSTRGF